MYAPREAHVAKASRHARIRHAGRSVPPLSIVVYPEPGKKNMTLEIVLHGSNIDWVELLLTSQEADSAPILRPEYAQVFFEVGDEVHFCTPDDSPRTGTVGTLNPKRARVRCGDGGWAVPYAGLQHLRASATTDGRSRQERRRHRRDAHTPTIGTRPQHVQIPRTQTAFGNLRNRRYRHFPFYNCTTWPASPP